MVLQNGDLYLEDEALSCNDLDPKPLPSPPMDAEKNLIRARPHLIEGTSSGGLFFLIRNVGNAAGATLVDSVLLP
jgi:hypothetical protein